MRIGEESQRREKEQRIAQIYRYQLLWETKRTDLSHGVPLSAIWLRWERLAKQKLHQNKTQECEKKNQSLYTGSLNSIESFSTEKLSK